VPVQGIDVVREDVATSTARTQIYSNPGDEAVVIQGAGFNIGATITNLLKCGATLASVSNSVGEGCRQVLRRYGQL